MGLREVEVFAKYEESLSPSQSTPRSAVTGLSLSIDLVVTFDIVRSKRYDPYIRWLGALKRRRITGIAGIVRETDLRGGREV